MKKIFIPLLLLLFAISFVIPVGAEEVHVTEAIATEAIATEAIATEAIATEAATTISPDDTTVVKISDLLKEWAPEIMSAASLVLSLVIAYLFKKGLLPNVINFLSTISETVKNSSGKVDEQTAALANLLDKVTDRLTRLEALGTAREEKLYAETELITEALSDMSDTLTDIFSNTNLPADTKAMITAKHKEHTDKIRVILSAISGSDADAE